MTRFAILASFCAVSIGCGGQTPDLRRDEDRSAKMTDEPVWTSVETVQAYCDGAIVAAERKRARLKAPVDGARTEANTLEPFNAMLTDIDSASGWAALIFQVHPDEAVRTAAQECQQRISRFETEVKLDGGLFEALSAVDMGALDPQAARFTAHLLRDFRRSGVDKDDATRERLKAIQEEMVTVGQEYRKNVSEDVRELLLDSPSDLDGLPEDYKAAHPPREDGKIAISTNYPDFFPFETYAKNGELRKELYRLFLARGFPQNKELLSRLLSLRHEMVEILGYPDWASYRAETRMAKSSGTIRSFIDEVTKITRPRSDADVALLLDAKRKDDPAAKEIDVWDRFYYVYKVREAKYDFDAQDVRPYFSYPKVMQGVLDLYADLFGLTFERLPDEPVWHPSVQAYALKADGKLVGKLYLDNHPRNGKFKHAAVFPIQTGDDADRLPMASLVANFPDPSNGDGNALMDHSDVVTIFHEFGHLIHHLLARRSPWITLAGFNVEWDFVEAPSQLLEEWAWRPEVLARFAINYKTGEPIPAELVRKLRAADEFGKGVHVMRQLFYTAYSFFLHTRDPDALDLDAFTGEIYAKYSPYPQMPGTHVYANFGHLVGYSSEYYTYQWSLAIAKDIFTRFDKEGVLNTDVARAYRRLILEPGGTRDASDMVKDFLGRPQNLEAYRKWLQE